MSTWIVGVDLRHRSDGAVRFGAWLRDQTGGALNLVGAHVLSDEALDELERFEGRTRVRERVRTETELVVSRASAQGAFTAVEVVEGEHPAEALAVARAERGAEGLIVGRKAARASKELVRLGSVARRLLQRLAAPTFVAPPDLDPAQLGAGPIVVAVTPAEASAGAVRVAARLAAAMKRTLVFVRAVSVPEEYAQIYWSGSALEEFRAQRIRVAEERTSAWLTELGHPGPLVVRYGDELEEILGVAREHDAPFIVSGSRLLNFVERLVAVSMSSELAARASTPVLVVPPDAR